MLEYAKGLSGQGHENREESITCREKEEEKKQLAHAFLELLIILCGMLTTDNYSVNPVEYLAISYCGRDWRAWPRWCHVYYFE